MDLLTDYTLISGSDNAINAIPASMYASQIWATPFLRQDREMDNPLQKWLLTVLKNIIGARDIHHSFMVHYAKVWPGASAI